MTHITCRLTRTLRSVIEYGLPLPFFISRLVAILYDLMFMYVGLFVHSAFVFHVFRPTDCAVVFYE